MNIHIPFNHLVVAASVTVIVVSWTGLVEAQTLSHGEITTSAGQLSSSAIKLDYKVAGLAGTDLTNSQVSLYHLSFVTAAKEEPVTTAIDHGEYELTLYPNPLSHHLKIQTDLENIGEIWIQDLAGKILRTIIFEGDPVDFSTLVNGPYLIRIFDLDDQPISSHMILKN